MIKIQTASVLLQTFINSIHKIHYMYVRRPWRNTVTCLKMLIGDNWTGVGGGAESCRKTREVTRAGFLQLSECCRWSTYHGFLLQPTESVQ